MTEEGDEVYLSLITTNALDMGAVGDPLHDISVEKIRRRTGFSTNYNREELIPLEDLGLKFDTASVKELCLVDAVLHKELRRYLDNLFIDSLPHDPTHIAWTVVTLLMLPRHIDMLKDKKLRGDGSTEIQCTQLFEQEVVKLFLQNRNTQRMNYNHGDVTVLCRGEEGDPISFSVERSDCRCQIELMPSNGPCVVVPLFPPALQYSDSEDDEEAAGGDEGEDDEEAAGGDEGEDDEEEDDTGATGGSFLK